LFEQEKIARSLLSNIKNYFGTSKHKVTINLNGAGVHWECIVKIDNYKVTIYSCDISYSPDVKGRTEEFIVSYFKEKKEISCGRTRNREKLIRSIEEWLNKKSKEQLYNEFDFVDHGLRKIQKLEREWMN